MVLGIEGEIADIAVAPDARGQGIGGVLLDRATLGLHQAGVRTLYLEVRESNHAARRLYESRQFGQVGRRKGYYQHPAEDALVLRRDLVPI
jgi:ribosomal-protein-alanine N-acetyltransferase